MKPLKVAILGPTGFIGRHVLTRLINQGIEAFAFPRVPDNLLITAEAGERALHEVADNGLFDLFRGCDLVVNCAGKVHGLNVGRSDESRRANITLPLLAMSAASIRRVNCFIHIGSVASIASVTPPGTTLNEDSVGEPDRVYGEEKRECDIALQALAKNTTMRLIILMPPMVYGAAASGAFSSLRRAATLGLPLPLAGLSNRRSLIHVENLADAISTAVNNLELNGRFIVTDCHPKTPGELYDGLTRASGRSVRSFYVPPRLIKLFAKLALGERALSLTANSEFDASRFREIANWRPPLSFSEAMRRCF